MLIQRLLFTKILIHSDRSVPSRSYDNVETDAENNDLVDGHYDWWDGRRLVRFEFFAIRITCLAHATNTVSNLKRQLESLEYLRA